MMHAYGAVGHILLGCWIVVGLLVAINPQRFFSFLSLGRVLLPAKLVGAFRILGVLNAVGRKTVKENGVRYRFRAVLK